MRTGEDKQGRGILNNKSILRLQVGWNKRPDKLFLNFSLDYRKCLAVDVQIWTKLREKLSRENANVAFEYGVGLRSLLVWKDAFCVSAAFRARTARRQRTVNTSWQLLQKSISAQRNPFLKGHQGLKAIVHWRNSPALLHVHAMRRLNSQRRQMLQQTHVYLIAAHKMSINTDSIAYSKAWMATFAAVGLISRWHSEGVLKEFWRRSEGVLKEFWRCWARLSTRGRRPSECWCTFSVSTNDVFEWCEWSLLPPASSSHLAFVPSC